MKTENELKHCKKCKNPVEIKTGDIDRDNYPYVIYCEGRFNGKRCLRIANGKTREQALTEWNRKN